MNKGTDLIQRCMPEAIDGYPTGNVYVGLTQEELEELEKELKAIEIIKETMPIGEEDFFYDDEEDTYYFIGYKISKEKFDLLKEVLIDG